MAEQVKSASAGTWVGSMKRFFGLKEGQSLPSFSAELKDLTYEEKKEFAVMLRGQPGFEDTPDPSQPSK